MVSLTSLWLPILLSAVAVFFASFLMHTVLKYHNTDFSPLPNEAAIMSALGSHSLPVGEYVFPHHAGGASAMKDPAFVERRTRGPCGFLTVTPNGMPGLGGFLAKWFVYLLVVSVFSAYLASRALPVGAEGSEVFRFTATVA